MNAYNSEEDIIQNLKDAGCSDKEIKKLITLYKEGKKEEIYRIMEKHRQNILKNVHKNEKQINCIDYFIYQMKRGENSEK